jgi:hypothetical protein
MASGDASSAEMRRLHHDPDPDPLALDDDTVDQLLAGALTPAQAPAGYVRVAQLLAAATAAPTPEELAGQGAVLTELRAAARTRPTAAMAPGRALRRRRRTGLAVVVVVGSLVTGGVAGAATGRLPGPVRDAARAIIGTGRGAPSSPTTVGQPLTTGAGAEGSRPAGALGPGSGTPGHGAGPAPGPALEGLCKAYAAGNGAAQGGKLDATAFKALATAAGGEDKVATFCEDLLPGDQKLKEPKETKDTKQPKEPGKPEQPGPSGTGGQGQGSPPDSTGGKGQGGPPLERARTP